MKPPPFSYRRPGSLREAVALLGDRNGEAKLIAGGQSLVPLLNFRLIRPDVLVDLNGISDLAYVRGGADCLAVGAMTRLIDAEESRLVQLHTPLLAEAVRHVGHVTIRNRGTVGGSIAHADPAAELPLVLLSLGGSVRTLSPRGGRQLHAEDLFLGPLQTALASDEIITEVCFPVLHRNMGWAFEEFARRHGDFALAMAAVQLALDGDGRVDRIAIGLGVVSPTPARAQSAEATLRGQTPTPDLLDAAASAIGEDIDPDTDIHATAEDRRHLAVLLGRRALGRALERAQQHREGVG